MNKSIIRRFILFLIITSILMLSVGCEGKQTPERTQNDFDSFINKLFVQEVQTDTLSLNYMLSEPENYGIEFDETTLGEYNTESMYKSLSVTENCLNKLDEFDYKILTEDQKLTYNIVKNYMASNLAFGDYLYYSECLGPTTGIQAQLPILLAEYNFYTKDDIDRYIELLPCVYDYFTDIADFQREKSQKGLFMSDKCADSIINQCMAFIEDPRDNFLIDHFNHKISDYSGLTDNEKLSYQRDNMNGITNHVIPAYEMLIKCLNDLKGTGKNDAGLYYFPEGQSYYTYMVKHKTGSDKDIDEIKDMLEVTMGDSLIEVTSLSLIDNSLLDKFMEFTAFPLTDPQVILYDLQKDIAVDFPELISVDCEIKYVPESLSEFLSPALYLIPAIDDYTNNNIYINGTDDETLSTIYTTIAHEGYPGHLYQNVYFRSQNPAPIRNLMNFTGYDEGWATYVELYSFDFAGIDENLANFLKLNTVIILCMYARADIGVHYDGWNEKKAVNYIENYVGDETIAKSIYNDLLQEPAVYLPYAVGYLEIKALREKSENSLGQQFDVKDFHQFILDIGPAQFEVINDNLEVWIAEQK